jgi:hypothetical protein
MTAEARDRILSDLPRLVKAEARRRGALRPAGATVYHRLVDVDPAPATLAHDQRVLFSGMTRATVRLEVVARRGNPLNDALGAGPSS